MCFATLALAAGVAGAGASAGGSILGGEATGKAAGYSAQVARNNAIIADQNAVYAEQAGAAKATTQGLKNAQTAGKIKAGQAAGGVDVNTGSAKAVQVGAREVGKLDTETVLNNSELQAYGYRSQATSDIAQSQLDEFTAKEAPIGADIGAAGSLLSSASSLGFKWAGSGGNPFSTNAGTTV